MSLVLCPVHPHGEALGSGSVGRVHMDVQRRVMATFLLVGMLVAGCEGTQNSWTAQEERTWANMMGTKRSEVLCHMLGETIMM